MEMQKPKIAFYVRRSFGEKLSACFDFIRENWKPLLKYSTYFILPLALIQAFSMNSMMNAVFNIGQMANGGMYDSPAESFLLNDLLLMLCFMVGNLLLMSVVYALMQLYNTREERLNGITFKDIRPFFFKNMRRLLWVILFSIVLCIAVIFVIATLTALLSTYVFALLIFLIPAIFVCIIPLMLWVPIYLFEDISVMAAFGKSFKLGFSTWGGTFAVIFIMGLMGSIVQGALATPWTVVNFVQYYFTQSGSGSETPSLLFQLIKYVLGVLVTYGAYISAIISLIGLIYQYGHASELIDSTSVESDIDNFEQL